MSSNTDRFNRLYPKSSYGWFLFRRDFLGKDWTSVKQVLRDRRSRSRLPARFRDKSHWSWLKFWTRRYCDLLSSGGSFRVNDVPGMGLGIFASQDMKKGSLVLFGHLHRVTHKTVLALDKLGETSLMQVAREEGRRIDWYYMGGPASMINHTCKGSNAEFVLDDDDRRGANGEMLVRLTRNVAKGEEILANYGDKFWNDGKSACKCATCCLTRK